MEQTLRDLGYEFGWIVYSGADKNPVTFFKSLKSFTNNAPWSKILSAFRLGAAKLKALDDIERAVHHFRAVELEKGTTNRILNDGIQAIDDAPNISSLKRVVREYNEKLAQIPQIPDFVPLKVCILGEPVVILEPFSNMGLEAELGRLGVEVNRTRSNYYSEWLKLSAFFNALNVDKKKLRKYAYPYLKRDPGGHAIESIGDKVYRGEEYDGIIHVVPFTCMPEIVAQNIMPSINENDTPVLVVTCDEQTGKAGMVTRLEAFVDLLKWRRKRKG
jgi:predicted nucleotide-binding protein (sugar kinase/HSP70/actin superfamily)